MKEKWTRHWLVLLSVIVLMGLLFLLISNLDQLELLPGKALPNPFEGISAQWEESTPSPEFGWVDTLIRILPYLFVGVFTLAVILSTIFYRKFRRTRIALIWVTVILLLLIFLLDRAQKGSWEGQSPTAPTASDDAGIAAPSVEVETPQIRSPNWGLILLVLAIALGIGAVAAFLILRLYPGIKSRLKQEEDFLELFGERAGEALDGLHRGKNLQDVVSRCYKDMSEMLSRECRITNTSFLTPHEFALLLRDRGVEDEHVKRLTALFEQVRYGGRSGKPFANEAIDCLSSIQRIYAVADEIG